MEDQAGAEGPSHLKYRWNLIGKYAAATRKPSAKTEIRLLGQCSSTRTKPPGGEIDGSAADMARTEQGWSEKASMKSTEGHFFESSIVLEQLGELPLGFLRRIIGRGSPGGGRRRFLFNLFK